MADFKKFLKDNKNFVIIFLTPIIAAPLPIAMQSKQAYCGYALIVILTYWVTECLPLAISSLVPVFIFPMFGILESAKASMIYFEDINMLFFGGLVMAMAIEKTCLHQRIAIKSIMFFGSDPKWLLLGIMFISGFLSLWISNTASASMMLPITIEIVKQLIKTNKDLYIKPNDRSRVHPIESNLPNGVTQIELENVEQQMKNENQEEKEEEVDVEKLLVENKNALSLMKGFCLSIMIAAGMGGTGSLVGTTPNLLLKSHYDRNYPTVGLNFLTYMLFSAPTALIMIIVAWVILSFLWLPKRYHLTTIFTNCKKKSETKSSNALNDLMIQKYKDLGPFSWEQKSVAVMFIALVILWVSRDFYFVPGWGHFFPLTSEKKNYISDTTPSIFMMCMLVAWPKKNIFKGEKYEHLLSWEVINADFSWYIILLGGASLVIAEAFKQSGLSNSVGELLELVVPNNDLATLIIVLLFALAGTEVTSNTAMEAILLPVVDGLAQKSNSNPNYFLIPLTLAVSLAFILPIATSTNAVVFSCGYIKVKDMVITGIILKLAGAIVVVIAGNLWLNPIFKDPRQLNITLTTTALPNPCTTLPVF